MSCHEVNNARVSMGADPVDEQMLMLRRHLHREELEHQLWAVPDPDDWFSSDTRISWMRVENISPASLRRGTACSAYSRSSLTDVGAVCNCQHHSSVREVG